MALSNTDLCQQQVDQQINLPHESASLNDWVKIDVLVEQYPQFSITQMRWLLLHRESNGLSQHVRKIGKPLYIDIQGFLQWIKDECK